MTKNAKILIVAVLVVAVLSVALVGCTNFVKLEGGDADATTFNNNSLVVTQGDYIYFVNGKITVEDIASKEDNKYGKITKSAIYRAKKDGSNVQVVVPQVAMDANNANGISVLGGYIYFTSPSTATDKTGALQTKNTDFYRVQINGDKLEKITTLQGNTMQYKFTDKGLIYFEDSKLYFVNYESKKTEEVAERVGGTYFPITSTYEPAKADATMNVFFTVSPDEKYTGDPYNDIKYVTANGEVKDFLSGKEKKITYSLKNVEKDGEGVAVYYEKSVFDKVSESKGLFGVVTKADLKASAEKQFTNRSDLTVRYNTFEKGVYVFENNEMYIPNIVNGQIDAAMPTLEKYSLLTSESAAIANTDIFTIRTEGDTTYMYYFATGGLNKVAMLENELGVAEILIEKNIVTDFVKPILDGNTFYYINSGYYNYMYKVDLSKADSKHSILGVRTEADKEAYIKYVKELKDDAKEAHNKLIQEDLKEEAFK